MGDGGWCGVVVLWFCGGQGGTSFCVLGLVWRSCGLDLGMEGRDEGEEGEEGRGEGKWGLGIGEGGMQKVGEWRRYVCMCI